MLGIRYWLLSVATVLLVGCSQVGESEQIAQQVDGTDSQTSGDSAVPVDTDTEHLPGVNLKALSAEEAQLYEELAAEYTASLNLTPAQLREQHDVLFAEDLSYNPGDAAYLDLIQESALALSDVGLAALEENGFTIVDASTDASFFRAYESVYKADLPVYITVDSILDALHRSYDNILKDIEREMLVGTLGTLLDNMRTQLAADTGLAAGVKADVDVYLAVARSLLSGTSVAPVAGGDADAIADLVAGCTAAAGMETVTLFGAERMVDFSQCEPRGHYTEWGLQEYFRAMMWLGRIDLRLVESDSAGQQSLNRPQVEAMLAMEALMDSGDKVLYTQIDQTLRTFVGESDNMTVLEVDALKADLGITGLADLDTVDDETMMAAILTGGYGRQQIASHLMVNDMSAATLPLNSSFLLFGQRFVIDSHVFSQVVYDRVNNGKTKRMMPDPLDAAFGALDNDFAATLLKDEMDNYDYASELHMSRVLVDAHQDGFWQQNLYNLWLSALRTIAPNNVMDDALPDVFKTERWARRLTNSQLGSWAELRHDTLLYAKQSVTEIPGCEYPDAYVEPYPAFYQAVADYAREGKDLLTAIDPSGDNWISGGMEAYFSKLEAAMLLLKQMADQELAGEPFTDEQLAFINDTVYVASEDVVCAMIDAPYGWYTDLFYNTSTYSPFDADPVVADVHTQPADESGAIVGKVLHVGVGQPRMMVVTVNTCSGPKAYIGPVFAYHEVVTDGFDRLTDERWYEQITIASPADVPWMAPVLTSP